MIDGGGEPAREAAPVATNSAPRAERGGLRALLKRPFVFLFRRPVVFLLQRVKRKRAGSTPRTEVKSAGPDETAESRPELPDEAGRRGFAAGDANDSEQPHAAQAKGR